MGSVAPRGAVAPVIVARLPEPIRRRAARRAVARLKHDGTPSVARERLDPVAALLLAGALACSAALGYAAGGAGELEAGLARSGAADGVPHSLPGIGAALAAAATDPVGTSDGADEGVAREAAGTTGDDAGAIGAGDTDRVGGAGTLAADPLWAELGRVRAEILRLRVLFRRLADVAQLEDGEFDLALEPTELPDVRDAATPADALEELSIRALDPISDRSTRMARIFDERRGAHDRRVGGAVAIGTVRTSGFGHRASPHGGRRQLHRGVDLAGRPGTPIRALADGVVTWSGKNGGYGNLVELEHGDGFRTRYAHNRSNLVALGERVRKGEVVATLGSSGRSTGPHVHVEVRRHGAPLDPARFVR